MPLGASNDSNTISAHSLRQALRGTLPPGSGMDYEAQFRGAVLRVRAEGRYRVFADLERQVGRYPTHEPTKMNKPSRRKSGRFAERKWGFPKLRSLSVWLTLTVRAS